MPVGVTGPVTVAVKVTPWFRSEGFTEDVTVVLVAALVLVNANDTDVAPVAEALTLYEPPIPLAVALVLA